MKMLRRAFDPPYEFSWAEKKAIVSHCLRSQDKNPALCEWIETALGDQFIIHIAGTHIEPDVLSLDMENLIIVSRDSPAQQDQIWDNAEIEDVGDEFDDFVEGVDYNAIGKVKDLEFLFQVSKSEAICIIGERNSAPNDEEVQSASRVYTEVMKARFEGEPFVYLTGGKRTLPIRVPFITL